MRLTSLPSSSGGVLERQFIVDDRIPGVLWTPEAAAGPRPLILIGHGGGQHKQAPGVVGRARHFVTAGGFAVAAVDAPQHGDRPRDAEFTRATDEIRASMMAGEDVGLRFAALHGSLAAQAVEEWQSVVTALHDELGTGPVGYAGLSMGCGLGVPFVAADSRVRAAVLGLCGPRGLNEAAAAVTVPVLFLLQWDDQLIAREQGLALFEALGSTGKTLHANPGGHADVPFFETENSLRFFTRHLRSG